MPFDTRLPHLFILLLLIAGFFAAATSPAQAQSDPPVRIDEEFNDAADLAETGFTRFIDTNQSVDGGDFVGLRANTEPTGDGPAGTVANSAATAAYVEGYAGSSTARSFPAALVTPSVNTTGVETIELVYRVREADAQAGPDNGKTEEYLQLQYRTEQGTWVTVKTVEAQGQNRDYSQVEADEESNSGDNGLGISTTLDRDANADAFHDSFAIRFLQQGTSARDPWYVDDVCILPGGGTCTINNQTPEISDVANQTLNEGESTGALPFTVGDAETSAGNLTVTPSSSNTTLLPSETITLDGTGSDRTVTAAPVDGESGTATVTLTVDDGTDELNDTFTITVAPDVAFTDGSSYTGPSGQPGESGVPVGRFQLQATGPGPSVFNAVTIDDQGTGSGFASIELWRSADDQFDSTEDTQLLPGASITSFPVTFSGLDIAVPQQNPVTLFLVVDLGPDADGETVPVIEASSDLEFDPGALGSPFSTAAPLSADGSVLPVELTEWTAAKRGESVVLSWQTASETGNAGFRIQRQVDDGSWQTIGRRDGAGTTNAPQRYRFEDADLPYALDRPTYRLKQVDLDGTVHYSETVSVERDADRVALLGTYPNPAREQAAVRFALPEREDVTIRLFDMLGREVESFRLGSLQGRQEQTLDLSTLSSGTYLLRLEVGDTVRTRRLTLVR
jgi:hypothetical protein